MTSNPKQLLAAVLALAASWSAAAAMEPRPAASVQASRYLSPTALVPGPNNTLYVACATGGKILVFDTATARVLRQISFPGSPSGLTISADGKTLIFTCSAPESLVCLLDTEDGSVRSIPAGHTAMAPVVSPDGKTLYVCNRFNNEVVFIDLASGSIRERVAVPREPVSAALTPDGRWLLVANHLHAGRADADFVASCVSVIDTVTARVTKQLVLPNGSGMLREVRIAPDGKLAAVTHQISRFHLPTTQVERGWINSNALTLIDLEEMRLINSVLLDNVDRGAANPWALAWSADSQRLVVTHAGTHEISVIQVPALVARLAQLTHLAPPPTDATVAGYLPGSRIAADVPNDLAFLVGLRQRVRLPESDRGPRAVVLLGNRAFVANYFSDTLAVVDLAKPDPVIDSVPLGSAKPMTLVRRGEMLFNDGTICFQSWQSCASCHSSDARVDGLNWDLLNDGIGNPKNVKSLLLAHRTPPSMAMGVREGAQAAVRAGIRHSLFTVRPEEDAVAIDEFLKSLEPIPSPLLVKGQLSPAAERGRRLFEDPAVGCAGCHPAPLYTDLNTYDVGTVGRFDQADDRFDTPTLVELWRTAPYLHDGRAPTVKEVVTKWNRKDQHGKTSHLTAEQIDDLVVYLLSLQ